MVRSMRATQRAFEMMFNLDSNLPREDTIRSLDDLSEVKNTIRGREANHGNLLEGAELISISKHNLETGEITYYTPEEFKEKFPEEYEKR